MKHDAYRKIMQNWPKLFNKDEARVDWHDETLWWIRQKRDKAAWSIGEEWEPLRETASQIKDHTLSNLHAIPLAV